MHLLYQEIFVTKLQCRQLFCERTLLDIFATICRIDVGFSVVGIGLKKLTMYGISQFLYSKISGENM